MVRISLVMAGMLGGLCQQTAQAAPNVAVINIAASSDGYQKRIDLEAKFDIKRKRLNSEHDLLADKIERKKKSLEEEFKPGTSEYAQREKELVLLQAEMQYFMESSGRDIERGLAQSLRAIFDDIGAMVRTIAQERGIDIVLAVDELPTQPPETPNQARQQIVLQKVLYWSPKTDITADVVSRLNAVYIEQQKGTE